MRLRPKPKFSNRKELDKEIDKRVETKLSGIDVRGDLRDELDERERTQKQKEFWDMLSPTMKVKVLKHVIERRQAHGKK